MKVTVTGHVRPTARCCCCYQRMGREPVPVLSEWRLKSAPFLHFKVAAWACGVECFHELMRDGLEADADSRNITQLAWATLGLDASLTDPLSKAPEVLAASGHSPPPPAPLPPPGQPVRDGRLLVTRPASECRCMNCLARNPRYPVCTQVVTYGATRDPPIEHPDVVTEADGVQVHTPSLITNTSEKFWIEHNAQPFHAFVVYGYVCGPDCGVWAVGAPGGVGWRLPAGELYYATNVFLRLVHKRGLPAERPDLYAGRIRRAGWAGCMPALAVDPFRHMAPFDAASVVAQEQASTGGPVTPSLLSAVLEKLNVADDIRARIKRARNKKVPE